MMFKKKPVRNEDEDRAGWRVHLDTVLTMMG
jgi:hypothetical protein